MPQCNYTVVCSQASQNATVALHERDFPVKATACETKHGVGFEEAKSVFSDERAKLIDAVRRQARQDVHAVYELVSANQADANRRVSVRAMCRVLGVSHSGYYGCM